MFKDRNAWIFFLLCVCILLLFLSFVFLFSQFKDFLTYIMITGIILMISGYSCIVSFINNRRGYFRPGWILTQGFVQIAIGMYILFNRLVTKEEAYLLIFGLWAIFTAVSQISVSIQIKSLDINRWWLIIWSGIINLIIGFLMLLNPFRYNNFSFIYYGLFLLILSISCVLEVFVYRKGKV